MTSIDHTPKAKDNEAKHPQDAPTAQDIMRSAVKTVEPDTPLADVVALLLKHKISSVPVVTTDAGDRLLVGFVSEADCLEYLSNEIFYGNPSPTQTAGTIMSKHPVCVAPSVDVFTLASILVSHRFRHVPVVDRQRLLGIVSRRDVLDKLEGYYRHWNTTRDRERFPVDLHAIMNHRFLGSS